MVANPHVQQNVTGPNSAQWTPGRTPGAFARGNARRNAFVERRRVPRHRGRLALKRSLDVAGSALFLAATLPLLCLIAVLVRLDSPGPALFRQTRIGRGGRPFDILKFRTMTVQENDDAIVQACRDDARVTRLGRFLRRTSLDELPQFINVLRGDMSLVGPRPHASAHDRYYAALIEDYALRQRVKPGITGWAQIHGHRGPTPTVEIMQDRVRHDVWYVQNSGLLLDVRIILETPVELLRQRNAF